MINTTNITKHFSQSAVYALTASITILSLLFIGFFAAEPSIGHGQVFAENSNDFYIRQTITDESSFLVQPTDVTMNGSINGVSGGNATGTTAFVVQSNNAAGYYVTIDFFDNGTTEAMVGDISGSEAIRDYDGATASGMQPSYNFTASSAAQFAYTITSSTSADTDLSFINNGAACNAAGAQTDGKCWMTPSTTEYRIVDRSSAAVSGATSTLKFKVNVPSGATPVPQAETYTATATLSLYTK